MLCWKMSWEVFKWLLIFMLLMLMQIGLVAVSSKDKDPIDKFVDLFNTNQLPPLLNDGAMDPKILKYFLLVHDNKDGMLEKYVVISFLLRPCRCLISWDSFTYMGWHAGFECDLCETQLIRCKSQWIYVYLYLFMCILHIINVKSRIFQRGEHDCKCGRLLSG